MECVIGNPMNIENIKRFIDGVDLNTLTSDEIVLKIIQSLSMLESNCSKYTDVGNIEEVLDKWTESINWWKCKCSGESSNYL